MTQLNSWSFFLLASAAVHQCLSLTNVRFYEELKPYLNLDIAEDKLELVADDGSDVILLPGGPDDELDIAFLLKELGFTHGNASESEADPKIASLLDAFKSAPRKEVRTTNDLKLWWTHHHHHHHHHHYHKCPRQQFVQCFKRGCAACVMQTFAVEHYYSYHRFTINMCIRVEYQHYRRFLLSFTLNGYRLLYTLNNLARSTFKYCYHVPHLVSRSSRLCANLYSINRSRRTMCARITGTANIKGHVRSAYQNIGCFRIPCNIDTPANESQDDTNDLSSNIFDPASDDLDSGSVEENENQDGGFEDMAEDDSDSALRYE
ncbi:uncharacterized protein LOC128216965 [Mya arenaria]|uniref:uncharacterized protein LOC128216965 n=1 Tax=Mya arenaria TaxID=6604 RepID=UPI0022E468B3|nr:uncharacterized protein LOC128216965 [Mya arenaria]